MDTKDLKTWAETYCPQFLRAFERSKTPFEALVKGTKVMTLRSGFSGGSGIIREVASEIKKDSRGQEYLELVSPSDPSCVSLLYKDDKREGPWYFSVMVVSTEELEARNKLNRIEERTWEATKVGKRIEELGKITSLKNWDR